MRGMAAVAKVEKSQINGVELGHKNATIDVLNEMARAYGADIVIRVVPAEDVANPDALQLAERAYAAVLALAAERPDLASHEVDIIELRVRLAKAPSRVTA